MRSPILKITIYLLLYAVLNSCDKDAVSSGSEDSNTPPDVLEFMFWPNPPLDLSIQNTIEIQAVAVDPDSDDLTYNWESVYGVLESPVRSDDNLTVLQVISTGNYRVNCIVSDGKSFTVDSVLIEVIDSRTVLPASNLTYTDHIKRLFRLKCGSENGCHSHLNTGGPPIRGLDLTSYQSILIHLIDGSEPIIVPGQSEQSFLYKILLGQISDRHQMPKNNPPLNSNDINGVKVWIDEGAPE